MGPMTRPRICIFGAGAIGGLLGARLALAGARVAVVARGAHLAAIRATGLRLQDETGERVIQIPATADCATLGTQDFVILAVKTTALEAAADAVQPLLGPETIVVAAANGVPWWYFDGPPDRVPSRFAGRRLASVDP